VNIYGKFSESWRRWSRDDVSKLGLPLAPRPLSCGGRGEQETYGGPRQVVLVGADDSGDARR
jgi:hypothetical protein